MGLDIRIDVEQDWRQGDPAAGRLFLQQKSALFASKASKDGYINCEGCGAVSRIAFPGGPSWLTSDGFFDIHHINGDHHDHRQENLCILCPFCHAPFHLGFHCRHENGFLIFAPDYHQINISRIAFISSAYYYDNNQIYVLEVKRTHSILSGRRILVDQIADFEAGTIVAEILKKYYRFGTPEQKEALPNLVKGLRFFPDIEQGGFGKAIQYWQRLYSSINISEEDISSWVNKLKIKEDLQQDETKPGPENSGQDTQQEGG